MIQPNLSLEAATQDFAAKGRCRIEGFLDSDIAERLYSVLSEKTDYDVAYDAVPRLDSYLVASDGRHRATSFATTVDGACIRRARIRLLHFFAKRPKVLPHRSREPRRRLIFGEETLFDRSYIR